MAGLPWFKQAVDLRRDPRALILGDILEDPRAWTYVVEMRMYLSEHAPTGCVSGVHADIAFERGSGWTGERGRLLAALRDAGFVSAAPAREGGGIQIEDLDWAREQGAHVTKFRRDAEKPDGRSHKVVNPSRDTGGSVDAPARLPRGESRELRVESREEATDLPPASRSPPEQGALLPGVKPPKPRKAKSEAPGDPRHRPLTEALVAAGWPHHGGRTAGAVKELLGLANQHCLVHGGDVPGEVQRRAAIAKAHDGFPRVRELHELVTHWGHFERQPMPARGPAPPSDFETPFVPPKFDWLEKPT